MDVILADSLLPRIEIMDITAEVLVELDKRGVNVPLVEIDEQQDNLFITVRTLDHLSGLYLGIENDHGMVNIWLNDRGHSGGDPTLDSFHFQEINMPYYLDRICELFMSAPKY